MNVVALRTLNQDTRTWPEAARASAPKVDCRAVRVEIFDDFADAEPYWRALEQPGTLATPYQNYDLLRLWHRHLGSPAGVTPCLVVGFNGEGTPLFVWPLGRRTVAGLRVVEFLGGKHANFNMALWRRDVAELISADRLRTPLKRLSVQADLVMLSNQPVTWDHIDNPFAMLPHQPSPSFGYSGALSRDFDALFEANTSASARKKLRRKERLLAGHGDVRFQRAEGPAAIRAVLDDFFEQKTARTRAIGLPDVFGEAGVRKFIRAAAETPANDGQLIELYTLTVGGVIVATIGGVVADGRFSAMFIAIAHGLYSAESPGQQLLIHMVRHCCERGLHTFDLGIGEAKYKDLFCPDAEPMFDSYWPLTRKGSCVAFVLRTVAAAKRAIKQNPKLWGMVLSARRFKARLSNAD
jgi:CelD/BcsL family acetyltransferase involved in cellulose biosynthesis